MTSAEQRRADALIMLLRLDEALPHALEAGDPTDLARLQRLAVAAGRARTVKRLQELLPPAERLDAAAWRAFLIERALPMVPIGGDVGHGFYVDEAALAEIARDLGEPVKPLLAKTVRRMIGHGSRQLAKLYVLSRLSGDAELVRAVEPGFDGVARWPRRGLAGLVEEHLAAAGGRVVEVLERGDGDDYNPKSASVFLAELGGRRVVLKEHLRLPVDFSRIDGYSREREALEAAAHPAIVRLSGTIRLRRHEVLVLELAEGGTLARHATAPGLLGRGEALRVAAELAGALAHLHERGVVYLDLKPKNVVHGGPGAPVTLVDFGLARPLAAGKTNVRSVLSTPAYAPPEMAGELEASPASDVFQLGLVLYELLTGRHPFAPDAAIERHRSEPPREEEVAVFAVANLRDEPHLSVPELDGAGLRDLIRAMLEKAPERRPTAADARAALGRAA